MEVRLCQLALACGKTADKQTDAFTTVSADPHRNLTGGTALEVKLHSRFSRKKHMSKVSSS